MNTLVNNPYYTEMLHKNRLIPFFIRKLINGEDKLICFITFYIINDETKYVNANPWDVLDDNPDGKVCYINQLLTSKAPDNPKLSYEIWHRFKIYIKDNFPAVQHICWRRWDKLNQIVKTYKKEMRKCQN